jgi:hypothetical protein
VRTVVTFGTIATVVVALATAEFGCGNNSDKAERPSRPVSAERAMHVTCERSWTPTLRTFGAAWRQNSVRAGSVTLLQARRLAHAPIGNDGRAVKIRTLVHPRTPVTIAIGRSGRSIAGIVPLERSGQGVPMAETQGTLLLDGCDVGPIEQRADVPKRLRSLRELGDVGFPLTIAVARPACVPLEITTAGNTIRRTISIGAGRCA